MFRARFLVTTLTMVLGLTALFAASASAQAAAQADPDLKKLGFGVAVDFKWNIFSPDMVAEASIDSQGIVRVDKRVNTSAGFSLEMHTFIIQGGSMLAKDRTTELKQWGMGPFVMIQPGTEQIIHSVGMGWMFGWRLNDAGQAFTLGFGYAAIPSAKVLGSEFVEGQPAPPGTTAIRYQTRDKGSVLALVGFSF